jgi:hypothetical protein
MREGRAAREEFFKDENNPEEEALQALASHVLV